MYHQDLESELSELLEPERASIPDDGFSDCVLARLPLRQPQRWFRPAIIPGMTLIGSLLGLILLPGADSLTAWLLRLPNAQFFESIPLSWLVVVYLLCWTAVASVLDRRQALPAGFAQIEDLVRSSP